KRTVASMSGVTSARWLIPRQRGSSFDVSVMPSRLRPCTRLRSRVLLDGERPQLTARRDRTAWTLRLSVALSKSTRIDPGHERLLVPPAGHHQPRLPTVVGAEQLEVLEALRLFDLAGASREPSGHLLGAIGG